MEGEAAVAILASEGLAQVAVSCQHARRSFVPPLFSGKCVFNRPNTLKKTLLKFPPKNGVTPKLPSEVAQCL